MSTGQKLNMSRYWAKVFPSGGSGGESVPLPFPVSRSQLHSLAHGPLLLQSQKWWVESFFIWNVSDLPSDHSQEKSSVFKSQCD